MKRDTKSKKLKIIIIIIISIRLVLTTTVKDVVTMWKTSKIKSTKTELTIH